jgi:hypothetical protein
MVGHAVSLAQRRRRGCRNGAAGAERFGPPLLPRSALWYATPRMPQGVTSPTNDWPKLVGESIKQHGVWHTYAKLLEARRTWPADDGLRGYVEILRNRIAQDFLSRPKGMQMTPRLSPEFLSHFDRFNLSAQEGYLMSLIDGRLDLHKLLLLSPFDPFTTIFILAKLEKENAITIPQ